MKTQRVGGSSHSSRLIDKSDTAADMAVRAKQIARERRRAIGRKTA